MVSESPREHRSGQSPETDDELYELVKALWGITIPRHKVCADHDAPFDAFADAYFNRMPQILIHGSRGLCGKSRLMCILGLTKAAVLGSDVNIVGGSLNQSINIHNTIRDAWEHDHAPKYLIKEETATRIKLTNKAIIMPLTASQKTVRGPHPPSLLLDEIDEMDLAIFDASLGQPMPQENWKGDIIRPKTVMTSTWQYPDKTFADGTQRFKEEDNRSTAGATRTPRTRSTAGWTRRPSREARDIPAEMWRVEYDLGEPSIGNRAIDSEAVEPMFSLPEDRSSRRSPRTTRSTEFEEPKQDREYVIGADWAQAQDWTVITRGRRDPHAGQGGATGLGCAGIPTR